MTNMNTDHVTVGTERLREYSRSASTSTSRLSVSRENSHDPKRENSRESTTKSASSMTQLRENSQFWLRKISVTLVPPSPRSLGHGDELHAKPSRQMSQLRDTDSSRRASITITIITIAFILSYGPYMILWVYSLITFELELAAPLIDYTHKNWHYYLYLYLVSTTVLSTFNSSIFPLIYFVRIKGRMLGRVWDEVKGRWARIVEKSDNSYHRYIAMEIQRDKVRNGHENSPV